MTAAMTNDKMVPGRYLRWYEARLKVTTIQAHLNAGGTVVIANYLHATKYSRKHVGMFSAGKTGAYVMSGKSKVRLDAISIR